MPQGFTTVSFGVKSFTSVFHFLVKNEVYVQNDRIAIGSPLGANLANVFMVRLENTLVPRLHQDVKKLMHYVDHTYACLTNKSKDFVLAIISKFYFNTSFTFEKENKYHF